MAITAAATPVARSSLSRGAIAWAGFEGGRNVYVVLVLIYIFMPYVATIMVGDPVQGQRVIAGWNQYFGWIVLVTAPVLGAAVDKLGPRKGLLGGAVALMVPMIVALWWAKPDGSGLSVAATMAISLAVLVLFSYTEVLHNSLLVRAAGIGNAHRASGLALLLGNTVSVLGLAFSAWAFALPGKVDWPWVPAKPLLGLDLAEHEPERFVALLAAASLAAGIVPLLLFTPDAPRTALPLRRVLGAAIGEVGAMLRTVRSHREAVTFLAARMIFVDGMSGFLLYSGIYAVGVMKWATLEMFAYGLWLSVSGIAGGLIAPKLDARIGPRRALQVEIAFAFAGVFLLLGTGPHQIAFWMLRNDPPLWAGPMFTHLPDIAFLLIGGLTSAFVCGHFASSRTMMTRVTPPAQAGAFFGVYALAGVATGWLAPLLVKTGTDLFHSQQGGFAALLLLLGVGGIGLFFVGGGDRVDAGHASSAGVRNEGESRAL